MEQTDVRLKLLIDTKTERVLYGEADKKFIDFLFNLLSLPVGAVIRLLKKDGMVGCLGNLYESVETLNESYLQPNQSRDIVLKPKVLFNSFTKLLPNVDVPATPTPPATFCCNNSSYSSCRSYISDSCNAICPNCNRRLSQSCTYVTPPNAGNQPAPGRGFVKDLATYIMMDDLTVKHISDFSITTLLKKFHIKDVDSLEEKVITLDVHEVIYIYPHVSIWLVILG